MKLLRPLAGYTFYDYKTNDSIHRKLQTDSILDKIDEYRMNWLARIQRMPQNRIPLEIIPLQPTRKENNWETEDFWKCNLILAMLFCCVCLKFQLWYSMFKFQLGKQDLCRCW